MRKESAPSRRASAIGGRTSEDEDERNMKLTEWAELRRRRGGGRAGGRCRSSDVRDLGETEVSAAKIWRRRGGEEGGVSSGCAKSEPFATAGECDAAAVARGQRFCSVGKVRVSEKKDCLKIDQASCADAWNRAGRLEME